MRVFDDTFSGEKIYPGKVITTSAALLVEEEGWDEVAVATID